MKKKWAIIFLLVCLVIVVGIGGKVILDNKKEKQKEKLNNVERQSIVAVKQTFNNIKEIVIEKGGKNPSTGSYSFIIRMTNEENQTVRFSYIYTVGSDKLDSYGVNDRNIQEKGITNNKVSVIFSNGLKGAI